MGKVLSKFFSLIFCLSLGSNVAHADCLHSYQNQVNRESLGKDKSPYRVMLQALKAAKNPSSKSWKAWHQLLEERNSDFAKFELTNDEISLALTFLNKENALCKDPKPLKAEVVASSFFDLFLAHAAKLVQESKDLAAQMRKIYKNAIHHINTHSQINNSTDIAEQLELYGESLKSDLNFDFSSWKEKVDWLDLSFSLLHKVDSRLAQFDFPRIESDYYLTLDWEALRRQSLKSIARNNSAGANDNLLSRFLRILRTAKTLDFESFEILRNMTSLQREAYVELKSIHYSNSLTLASSIVNQWSFSALQIAIKNRLLDRHADALLDTISTISSELALTNFKAQHINYPTQVIAAKNHISLPDNIIPIYANEVELANNEFIVAYHTIPDTTYQPTLPIYIFQAYIAEALYGIKLEMLPRFRKEPFDLWPTVDALKKSYHNDHDKRWRNIGIAASPSLVSETESPPYKDFKVGYTKSGASKPNCTNLIKEILLDLNWPEEEAQSLAELISHAGVTLFKGVGGSILQIGLKDNLVCDYLFLCSGATGINSSGEPALSTLRSGNFRTRDQVRIILDPRIFLDPDQGRLFHYPYNPQKYVAAKDLFIHFLDEHMRPQLEERLSNTQDRKKHVK